MSNEGSPAVMDEVLGVLGYPEMLSLMVLLVGLLALAGGYVLKRQLDRVQTSQERLEDEISGAGAQRALKGGGSTSDVTESAVELLDQLREEIVALQFVRGANTAVIDRLDHALERLHEIQPDASASRATADALLGIVREVKEMRLAYAATSRKLEHVTVQTPAVPEPAAVAAAPAESAEVDTVAETARQAIAAFERDGNDTL